MLIRVGHPFAASRGRPTLEIEQQGALIETGLVCPSGIGVGVEMSKPGPRTVSGNLKGHLGCVCALESSITIYSYTKVVALFAQARWMNTRQR